MLPKNKAAKCVYIDKELAEKFQKIADEEKRSWSAEAVIAILEYISKFMKK